MEVRQISMNFSKDIFKPSFNSHWATSSRRVPAAKRGSFKNQRNRLGHKLKKATSKFHGVSYDNTRNAWMARLVENRKCISQKRFKTELEAAEHINCLIDTLKLDRPRNDV